MSITNNWWPEKYRPKTIEDYVGQPDFITRLKSWVETGEIPNLLFHSSVPGSGKTSAAKLIAANLDADVLYINASSENNVDMVRDKITMFVSSMGFKRWKIVVLDECLKYDTPIMILRDGKPITLPISEIDPHNDLIKSFNMSTNTIEWLPFNIKDVGKRNDMYKITLDDNQTIECTSNHKWYVYDDQKNIKIVRTDELYKYEHIISPL